MAEVHAAGHSSSVLVPPTNCHPSSCPHIPSAKCGNTTGGPDMFGRLASWTLSRFAQNPVPFVTIEPGTSHRHAALDVGVLTTPMQNPPSDGGGLHEGGPHCP